MFPSVIENPPGFVSLVQNFFIVCSDLTLCLMVRCSSVGKSAWIRSKGSAKPGCFGLTCTSLAPESGRWAEAPSQLCMNTVLCGGLHEHLSTSSIFPKQCPKHEIFCIYRNF